jgi:hypothetical protein
MVESLRRQRAAAGQFSESPGHNVSERRASLENVSCGSRPSTRKGKTAAGKAVNNLGFVGPAGVMTMARDKGNVTQTREIRHGGCPGRPTGGSRESDRAVAEDGEVHSTDEAG